MKFARALATNEVGSISVIPLLVVMILSALSIFGYLKISEMTLAKIRSKRMAEEIVFNVANRVTKQLALKPNAGCALAGGMAEIRNLSKTKPASIDQTWAPVLALNCILQDDEAPFLALLQIKVTPIVTDSDNQNLTRMVRVRVEGSTTHGPSGDRASSRAIVDRLINLRIANLAHHVLVLTGAPDGKKLQIDPSVQLDVHGSTYLASQDPDRPFNLDQFVNSQPLPYGGRVIFRKRFFTRSRQTATSKPALRSRDLTSVFTDGLQTEVFDDVQLPIYYAAANVWSNAIDYGYLYDVSTSTSSGYPPLPKLPLGTSADGTMYPYNAGKASQSTFPAVGSVIENLADTCSSPDFDRGDMKPMVLLRAGEMITLDFRAGVDPGKPPQFCGLIRAQKLRIYSNSENTTLFGHFFVDQLEVLGTGTVHLIDPDDSSAIPPHLAPPGGFVLLQRQLKGLEIYLGQPFYVPLAQDPQKTFSSTPEFLPRPVSDPMMYGCGGSACVCPDNAAYTCWPFMVSHPARDNDPAIVPQTPADKLFQNNGGANLIFTTELLL